MIRGEIFIMKLSDGLKGKEYIIENIKLNLAITRRLQMLGMTHGTPVSILGCKKSGPMIIKVRGTRFAIGKGFCDGIFVEEAKI